MAPALDSLYSDSDLVAAHPFLAVLAKGWTTGQPLPVSPAYQALSDAVADNAYAAITGAKKLPQAVLDLQSELTGLPLQ
jgi:multiple sugar transport system substrate-binding protein